MKVSLSFLWQGHKIALSTGPQAARGLSRIGDDDDLGFRAPQQRRYMAPMSRGGELGVLRVREHPLSKQVHPLIAKSSPSKQKKKIMKHHLKPISNKDMVVKA